MKKIRIILLTYTTRYIYETGDTIDFLQLKKKPNVHIDIITMKSRIKTNNVLRLIKKSIFSTKQRFSSNFDCKPNIECSCQKNKNNHNA